VARASKAHTVNDHFTGKDPVAREIYDRLLAAVRKFGPVHEEPKKTSIHLSRSSAFAGVQVRKAHLILTIKADRPFDSPRVFKCEQTSASRFHHEVKLSVPDDVDKELIGWLRAGYELSG
jgi:hypothetical protein